MIKSLPNLYSALHQTKEELKYTVANISNLYTETTRPKMKFGVEQLNEKGEIKYRELLVPKYKLKITQTYINNILNNIPLPNNMFGSVAKKNNILHAAEHLNQKYFLTIDLKEFFSNITSFQVVKMFYENGFSKDTTSIMTAITTLNNSLPQGAPSSPVIANLVIKNMVNEISAFIKPFSITFTSYVDDLAFSSKKCFKKLVPEIIKIIKKNGFFQAYKKIHYCCGRCEITGLIVCYDKLRIIPLMQMRAYTNKNLNIYVKRIEKFNLERKFPVKRDF